MAEEFYHMTTGSSLSVQKLNESCAVKQLLHLVSLSDVWDSTENPYIHEISI